MLPAEARAREAALVLHELPMPQRAKVLSQLDAAQRQLLKPLLQELVSLGIQAMQPLRDEAAPPQRRATVREQVGELDPRAAAAALRRCSAATVAAVLDTQDRPWQQAVLARFRRERRARIAHLRLADRQVPPPQVLDFLCARLVKQAQGPRTPGHRGEVPFLSRMRTWLRWTR